MGPQVKAFRCFADASSPVLKQTQTHTPKKKKKKINLMIGYIKCLIVHTILMTVWGQNAEEIVSVFKKLKKSFKNKHETMKQYQIKCYGM